MTDLRAFHDQMQTDGYWLGGYHGTGDPGVDGYGYPLGGYGYGYYGYAYGVTGSLAETGSGYLKARPGYEIQTLLAAADILAWH